MKLDNLKAPKPNRKARKRVGRGQGSGVGEQSGRGHNGQRSRAGFNMNTGFEGGQMTLQRRIPKYGFKNPFRTEYTPLNLNVVEEFIQNEKLGEEISKTDLILAGLIHKKDKVKLLGVGEISKKISIEVDAVSKSAQEKVEKAGGSVTISES